MTCSLTNAVHLFSHQLVRYLEEKCKWISVDFVVYNFLKQTRNFGNWLAHPLFHVSFTLLRNVVSLKQAVDISH